MGMFHASVLMLVGLVVLLASIFIFYITSGLWTIWIVNGQVVDMFAGMLGYSAGFVLILYPIVSGWINEVDRAYRS